MKELQKEDVICTLLAHSPGGPNKLVLEQAEARRRELHHGLSRRCQGAERLVNYLSLPFLRSIHRELDRKQSSPDWNQHSDMAPGVSDGSLTHCAKLLAEDSTL